ncbi:MAG TPA: GDSL-type esterase/lipase family protein [Baekduia sp.]|nr:GDSL-type esterase/lipase family protein [Baekduia sp.]
MIRSIPSRQVAARALAVAAMGLGAAGPAGAQVAPASLSLSLSTATPGWVAAHVTGPPGQEVAIAEEGPDGAEPVTTVTLGPDGTRDVDRAVPWRCDRAVRRLAVRATGVAAAGESGTAGPAGAIAQLRTPSCRGRLALDVRPARPRAGRRTVVRIRDRWGVGDVAARLCLGEPGHRDARCRAVRLRAGRAAVDVPVALPRPGRWRLRLRGPAAPAAPAAMRRLVVRPASSRLRVLATGDSMIQIIDGDLDRRLADGDAVSVRSDAHISTGITKPFLLDWMAHAEASASSWHPDVTVVFLGANDGYPMGTPGGGPKAPCCDAAWVHEYARRARAMMRAYARGGEGMVYWLLLPMPRRADYAAIYRPVNRALREAAAAFPGTVHLIDLGRVLTPGGRFRQTMTWHGHAVSVRQPDGIHLSTAGAEIATDLVVRALRRDGVIG